MKFEITGEEIQKIISLLSERKTMKAKIILNNLKEIKEVQKKKD